MFSRAVEIGERVLWLHTYGERFADATAGRPPGPPRAPEEERPLVTVTIPDTEASMPETIYYDPSAETLLVGAGRIAPVSQAVWEYETSGYKIVRRWFARRKREPEGRRSSPLDDIVATSWDAEWTTELLDLLNVLTLLVKLEPQQEELLADIERGELITVADLGGAGVLPVTNRPTAEAPPRQSQL